MANGIDQEIQSKVDAYRGNPQQLMQRYRQNQQLVDLLALQKLKSEKEAAAREMQMQMAQQPETIKQQREAELLGMTKQEMMQQTQGILQQRQAQQQKNMQQVAQQGIGALANQRPAAPQPAPQGAPQGQPMPKMAGGGIVAFQEGGDVKGRVTYSQWRSMSRSERERAGLPVSEIGGQLYFNRFGVGLGLNDRETGERIAAPRGPGSRQQSLAAAQPGWMERMLAGDEEAPAPIETAAPIERLEDTDGEPPAPRGAMSTMGRGPMSTTAAMQPERGGLADLLRAQPQPQMSVPEGGIPTVTAEAGTPETAATAVEAATTPTGAAGGSGGSGGLPSIGGGGAEGAMQRGFQLADQYTGRAEKAGRFADMEAELRAFDEANYDPEQERRDQLKAFLAGTANTSNFGSTMAGGTLASLNLRRQQTADRRQRLRDIFDMAERGMTLDTTLAEGGLRLGQQMYADAMANQRAALSAAASMHNAELNAEIRRAELDYNRLRDDRQFGLDERELDIEEARNEATQALTAAENDTRRFAAVSAALERIQDQETAVREYVVESSQLPVLQERLMLAGDDAEVAGPIEDAIRREEDIVAVRAEQIFDQMGGVEARDLLAQELLSFTGTGAAMLSLEDVAGITREE